MKVTTRDIARAAGVSQSTVSVVLSNNSKIAISKETRDRVLQTARSMGYQFRQPAPGREKNQVIGLLVPTLSNLYYPLLIQDIEIYARSQNITVVTQNTLRSEAGEEQCFRYLQSIGVKGVLCLFTPKAPIPEGMSFVIVGENLPGVEVDTVGLNSFTAGRMAAEHLLSLGHKHIAFITTPLGNMTDARRSRLEGVRARMEESGLADCLEVLADDGANEPAEGSYELDCGERLTRQLLEGGTECTAIVAVNDMTAIGCVNTLSRFNLRIPEDMAVCGFDNLMLYRMVQPQLTSVDQMAFYGCKIGLSILLEKMNNTAGESVPFIMEFKPRLHVRESTVKDAAPERRAENAPDRKFRSGE